MKLAVKDLMSFRDRFKLLYSIDEEKVQQLEKNIKSTKFWNNLVARPIGNGKYEIPFGHHRLMALKNVGYKEIDIPVGDYDDETFLKMAIQENATSGGLWMNQVNDIFRVYNFLKENKRETTEGSLVEFTSLPRHKIREALASLRAMGRLESVVKNTPSIKPEIFEDLTQSQGRAIREAVGITKASHKAQKAAIEKIKKIKTSGGQLRPTAVRLLEKAQEELGEKKPTPIPEFVRKKFEGWVEKVGSWSSETEQLLALMEAHEITNLSGFAWAEGGFKIVKLVRNLQNIATYLGYTRKQVSHKEEDKDVIDTE